MGGTLRHNHAVFSGLGRTGSVFADDFSGGARSGGRLANRESLPSKSPHRVTSSSSSHAVTCKQVSTHVSKNARAEGSLPNQPPPPRPTFSTTHTTHTTPAPHSLPRLTSWCLCEDCLAHSASHGTGGASTPLSSAAAARADHIGIAQSSTLTAGVEPSTRAPGWSLGQVRGCGSPASPRA